MNHVRQSIAWVMIERGVQVALAIIISALLARTYGAADFGTFQSYLSIASVWASVGLLCSAEILMPRYAAGDPRYAHVFEYAFGLRLIAALLACIGYLYFVLVHFDTNIILAIPLLAIVLLNEPFGAFGAYFQTIGYQPVWSKARLAALWAKFILIALVCVTKLPLHWVSVPYAVEAAVLGALITVAYVKQRERISFQFDASLLRELIVHGFIMGVGLSAMVWMQKLDRLFLTAAEQFDRLGFYAAGMQITENWFYVATMLVHAVAGRYVFSISGKKRMARIARLSSAFMGVAAIAWIIGALLAPWVIRIIYGAAFEPAVPFLRWQLGIAVLVWGDVALSLCLLANQKTFLFVAKWLLALLVAFLVGSLVQDPGIVPAPLHIPLSGYIVAWIFSLVYFLSRWNVERAQ